MQKKRSIKIISIVVILVLICVSITYVKTGNKEVLAINKEFNTENLQENEHMHVELDNSGDKVPVPNGYVGSKATGENEIDTGYVIYEGTEEVNDSNVEEAQKTRNQYVWIPVPDASTMYGTDENGKKWGKLYEFTTSTGNNIDPVTGAKPLNWREENGVMKIVNKMSNREPDIAETYDKDSILKLNIEMDSTHAFLIQLEKEFDNMIKSVKEYGGFFIGRYETGNLSKDEFVIELGNTDIGGQYWYTLYKKSKKLKNENLNVETGMLWGSQWDRTLMWLIESGAKNKSEIENSINWGNYKNKKLKYKNNDGNEETKNSGTGKTIPTGSSQYTRANNIYDLAGNNYEWTMELNYNKIYRGGVYYINTGVSYRQNYYSINYKYNDLGCRAMLYIK